MTFTLFSVNILLIFAIALFAEVRKGAKKGFVRTLISLGNIILSAIIASAFSPFVVSVLCNMFSIRLINLNTSYGNISTSANFTAEMFIFMAAAPFVAVLTFFLARGIIALIVAMIRKNKFNNFSSSGKYGSDERSYVRRNDKKLGIATGIICAFIVTAIVTAPLMGTVNILDRVLKMVESVDKKTAQNIGDDAFDIAEDCSNDIVGNVFYQFGGELMYKSSACCKYNGQRVYLSDEVDVAERTVEDFLYVSKTFQKPGEATRKQIRRFDELCLDIEESSAFDDVLADLISGMASAWKNGDAYLTIKKPVVGDVVEPAFNDILEACSDTNRYTAKANAITVIKIYARILESGIVGIDPNNFDALILCVSEENLIDDLNAILKENPHMSNVSVSSIAVDIIGDRLKNFNYTQAKYDKFMDDMADAINSVNTRGYGSYEERAEALSEYAMEYINDYGIDVPESVTKMISEELVKVFNMPDITPEDIKSKFEGYSG